jgi:hypothetical protein
VRQARWNLAAFVVVVSAGVLSACESGTDDGRRAALAEPLPGPVKVLSAAGIKDAPGEASPEMRLSIGRGADYEPIDEDPEKLFASLEGSMKLRRDTAWRIVEGMLQPQKITFKGDTYDVPLWHTWYEGASANPEVARKIERFIARVKACRADQNCKASFDDLAKEVVAATDKKDLADSLTTANMRQVLRQSEGFRSGPEELGQGFTLFSPSFVEHVLAHARDIDLCNINGPGGKSPWSEPPPSSSQFSHCIAEFPRSAVMVKANWEEVATAGRHHDTDAAAMTAVIKGGTWKQEDFKPAEVGDGDMYMIVTKEGDRFGLKSIHFSTKDVRPWVWISLWWSPDPNSDFGQDRPASLAKYNGGVWSHYKMCVTSSFAEGDAQPWAAFASQPTLAASLKATHEALSAQAGPAPYDKPTTWCSNPNLEFHEGNGRTNCIGCHQYSSTWNTLTNKEVEFSDTYDAAQAAEYPQFGRALRRRNFPAEFAWSFAMEFPFNIQQAKQKQKFEW